MSGHSNFLTKKLTAWTLALCTLILMGCGGGGGGGDTPAGDTGTPGGLSFVVVSSSVGETTGTVTLNVTRAESTNAAAIDYQTNAGTAIAGADYTTQAGTVSFAIGETLKTITIDILNDTLVEGTETFTVSLSNPSGSSLGTNSTHTVSITDDETLSLTLT